MEYDLRRNLKILKNRVMEEEIFQEDRTTKPEVIGGKKTVQLEAATVDVDLSVYPKRHSKGQQQGLSTGPQKKTMSRTASRKGVSSTFIRDLWMEKESGENIKGQQTANVVQGQIGELRGKQSDLAAK